MQHKRYIRKTGAASSSKSAIGKQAQKSPKASFDNWGRVMSGGKINGYDINPNKYIIQTQVANTER